MKILDDHIRVQNQQETTIVKKTTKVSIINYESIFLKQSKGTTMR
jgi:hypothetical protein